MNFAHYVESIQNLYLDAKNASEPTVSNLSSRITFIPKKILILAPHPDDECIMGGFAIRAKEEFQAEVGVVPFSFGSKKERRGPRMKELENALALLDFRLINPRIDLPSDEELTLAEFQRALVSFKPNVMIAPHLKDGHPVHIRASQMARVAFVEYANATTLTSDSIQMPTQGKEGIHLLQSEYWQSMEQANCFIPLSHHHLTKMGLALMAHVGEISRSPYHLTLPAWAMDQVRRGSEMSALKPNQPALGAKSEDAVFGQLYRLETL